MDATLIGDPAIHLANFNYAQYGDPNGALGKLSAVLAMAGGSARAMAQARTGKRSWPRSGKNGGTGGDVGYLGGGGAVTPPALLSKTEPEYSEEARKARLQGTVLLRIEVDTHGQPQNISVRQSLGLGLDDRAMEAVRKWKFIPGKVNGKPAVVVAYVEVNFRLL